MSDAVRMAAMVGIKRLASVWTRLGLRRFPRLKRVYRRMMIAASPPTLHFEAGGRRFSFTTNEPGCGVDMARGRYEPLMTRCLQRALRPGMTFVDVGAHVGYFTMIAARAVGPQGRVVAIEADPDTCNHLRQNIGRNDLENVELRELAVGSGYGTVRLYRDPQGPGYNSIYRLPMTRSEGIEVPQRPLDDVLEGVRPDVIKLDIEGAELDTLKSAKRTLDGHRHLTLFVEINEERLAAAAVTPRELARHLTDAGFTLWLLDDYAGRVARVEDPADRALTGLRWANLLGIRGDDAATTSSRILEGLL